MAGTPQAERNGILRGLHRFFAYGSLAVILGLAPSSVHAGDGGTPPPIDGPVFMVTGPAPAARFNNPLGITCAATGEILVADTGNHEVVIFSNDGAPLFRFMHYIDQAGSLVPGSPRCAIEAADGRIYITDIETPVITIVNARGEAIERIDPATLLGEPAGKVRAGYLAWGPEGQLHVTLAGTKPGVMVLDREHHVVRLVNGDAPERGALVAPTGLAIDGAGRLYVSDPASGFAVNVFAPDGRFVNGFGQHQTGWENFSFPTGVVLWNDVIWVADAVRQVVKGMSQHGAAVNLVGGFGSGPGAMQYPISLAADAAGHLFVLERAGSRFQVFELPAERVAVGSTSPRGE